MTEPQSRRTPANNLSDLREQLLRELSRLDEGGCKEPGLFRAYVQQAQVLAWRGVAEGRMDAPRAAKECLGAAQWFVDRHMPHLSETAVAAVEVYFAARNLHLATQALEARMVEDRISDKRSETEQAILQVLADNRGRYLRRGEIHEALKLSDPPTPARVGQILVELHTENVVVRIHGRAQGNPNAAFYALSPRGLELCCSLGLMREEAKQEPDAPPLLDQALYALLDPEMPPDYQSILVGLITSLEPTQHIRSRLSYWVDYWAERFPANTTSERLIQTINAAWDYRSLSAPLLSSTDDSEMLHTIMNTVVVDYQAWKRRHKPTVTQGEELPKAAGVDAA